MRGDLQGQVDIASSLQSHGSSMKVFTYLAGFEQGWTTSKTIEDRPLTIGDDEMQVNNWNSAYLGKITVRRALAESVNTAAVRAAMEVGPESVRSMAHRLGVTDLPDDTCGPPITLGACDVKLIDMTFAFATLANGGMMKGQPTSGDWPDGYREIDPVMVQTIVDRAGNVIYQHGETSEQQVVQGGAVAKLTDILSKDAVRWSSLSIDRPVAAKTGTSDEFRDGVVMGYTPDLATGVWVGNADNSPMASGSFSSAAVGPIWKRFMIEAHGLLGLPPKPFPAINEKPMVPPGCGGEPDDEDCMPRPTRKPPDVQPAAAPTRPPGSRPTAAPVPEPTETPPPNEEPTPTEEPTTESPSPEASEPAPTP
jgi:membrane peptidoglycan carboxypeptidase